MEVEEGSKSLGNTMAAGIDHLNSELLHQGHQPRQGTVTENYRWPMLHNWELQIAQVIEIIKNEMQHKKNTWIKNCHVVGGKDSMLFVLKRNRTDRLTLLLLNQNKLSYLERLETRGTLTHTPAKNLRANMLNSNTTSKSSTVKCCSCLITAHK